MYLSVYHNLCNNRKSFSESYKPGSGLHKHHIIPKHSGGLDVAENFTYLTTREHIIAHFLLYKIHKNPNDLRAMKMLGANLTVSQRKVTGEFCRDNNIGFHGATKEEKYHWRKLGIKSQFENKIGIHDPTMKSEYASLGGKASYDSGNNEKFLYWASNEGRSKRASKGGKAHKGKIWITRGNERTRIFPQDLSFYIEHGWIKPDPKDLRRNRDRLKRLSSST